MTRFELQGVRFNVACHPGHFGTFQDGQRGPYRDHDEMESFLARTGGLRNLVDVGAEYGAYSLVFTRHPDAHALAIEPSPRAFPMLAANIAANPDRHIRALNVFVGKDAGVPMSCAYLGEQLHADQGGGPDWHVKYGGTPMEDARLMLPQVPLDEICRDIPVDCIKIDTEGFECSVIRSGRATIEKWRPLMFLEVHATCFAGHGESAQSFMELMEDLRYTLKQHDGSPADPVQDNSFMRIFAEPR